MAKDNLTKAENINVTAREIDFVTRFQRNWDALRTILGIVRPIKKVPGAVLKSKKASVVLQSGKVGEGETIPYSLAKVETKEYAEMDIEKYAKATSIEAIKANGYDIAVGMTDDAFLYELQDDVTSRFYSYLNGGALTNVQPTFQKALAMAKGNVVARFQQMKRTCTKIVGFVNTLDVYDYLGEANITIQNEFGFNYIKNFMGYDTIVMLPANNIARGTVVATPVENIVLYYVSPSESDFARAGLVYTTQGVTPLIGFHVHADYSTAVSECFAIMGLVLFSEYLDGIAVVKVDSNGSLGSLTVTSAAGTASGTSKITVSGDVADNGKLYFYKAGTTAPTAAYLSELDSSWTAWDGESDIDGLTASEKITIAEVNGSGQVLATGNATITVKA